MRAKRHIFKDGSQVIESEHGWLIVESADAAKNLPHLVQHDGDPRSEADESEELEAEPIPPSVKPTAGSVNYW